MDLSRLQQRAEAQWHVAPYDGMRVPGIIFGAEALVRAMDEKVYEQLTNVTTLPGIVKAAFAMPDAHWGYGFPIGGVAAFDPEAGGVISAGGVGFDISCGVRMLHTGLTPHAIKEVQTALADRLFRKIPAGVGKTGKIHLTPDAMDDMLRGGGHWAVEKGYGRAEDLEYTEENGRMAGARPEHVSEQAKRRQQDEMGTLGSGNHYLEVQQVTRIYQKETAKLFGIKEGDIKVCIHCGSRGLGHQIGTEYLKHMVLSAAKYGIRLPDRELACAPIDSDIGREYLGAMRAGINCALANRQILTHLVREVFSEFFPGHELPLLYDVSHNTCKEETHRVGGRPRRLYVHRKGATRALPPNHPSLPKAFHAAGQPVIIGGTMGTASYVLAGTEQGMGLAFGSACHGAGRAMSRHQAARQWHGSHIVNRLAERGILVRSPSLRGIAEEAPDAYKNVSNVVDSTDAAGLARKVARLEPLICIKG